MTIDDPVDHVLIEAAIRDYLRFHGAVATSAEIHDVVDRVLVEREMVKCARLRIVTRPEVITVLLQHVQSRLVDPIPYDHGSEATDIAERLMEAIFRGSHE